MAATVHADPVTGYHKRKATNYHSYSIYHQDQWAEMGKFFDNGQKEGWMKPIVGKVYKLEEVQEAHQEVIEHSGGSFGKIVLNID